eukprot:1215395-Amphidinium_carterae.1
MRARHKGIGDGSESIQESHDVFEVFSPTPSTYDSIDCSIPIPATLCQVNTFRSRFRFRSVTELANFGTRVKPE